MYILKNETKKRTIRKKKKTKTKKKQKKKKRREKVELRKVT